MTLPAPTRALTTTDDLPTARVDLAYDSVDLQPVAQHMYALMVRNIASAGFPFTDSTHTRTSRPGCVLAAPSYPANAPGVSQDYVFHWVRDAAITALELAAAEPPVPGEPAPALIDYVMFAQTCQATASPTMGHACFTIDGQPRPWSEQNDGPAIQTIALLAAYSRLDDATRATAAAVIGRNVDYVLGCYRDPTTSLWEEHAGFSFFARSVQLRCLTEVAGNAWGIAVPAGTAAAIAWLRDALAAHWDGGCYRTLIGGDPPGDPQRPTVPEGYDPNIDIVQAAVYGAVACTDTKVLATAEQLLSHWADPGSPDAYPVNLADAELGRGPMLGRYPGDCYDGGSASLGNHPWPLCTANVAQLCYELATAIETSGAVPIDELSAGFFSRVGVTATTSVVAAVRALRSAAEAMLRAVVYHSDHLELSEQFDGRTGFEKSVRDLTWSYAAFLSAVRAGTGRAVQG